MQTGHGAASAVAGRSLARPVVPVCRTPAAKAIAAVRAPVGSAAVAAVLFVLSALCAGLANAPWAGWGPRPECLRTELWERWGDPSDNPIATIAATRLKLWEESHRLTQRRAALVFTAGMLQAAGAVALTTARCPS